MLIKNIFTLWGWKRLLHCLANFWLKSLYPLQGYKYVFVGFRLHWLSRDCICSRTSRPALKPCFWIWQNGNLRDWSDHISSWCLQFDCSNVVVLPWIGVLDFFTRMTSPTERMGDEVVHFGRCCRGVRYSRCHFFQNP